MHTAILRRTGGVLVAVGLVDIAVMVYCIANRISYSSSLNIFAVIAGILLLRGSLRAASLLRWFCVFTLLSLLSVLIGSPFWQPLDLTLTQVQLNPIASLTVVAIGAFSLWLLFWVARQLGRPPIQAALSTARIKQRDMRIPAAIGIGLGVILTVSLVAGLQRGASAEHAKWIAEQEVGAGYRFHVRSLSITLNNQSKSVSGVVTAWNKNEVKDIPVHWVEQ